MVKTSTGLKENAAGLLCYILGWLSGVIFLTIEPENKLVRFHAVQSIIVFGTLNIIWLVLYGIASARWFIGGLIGVLAFIFWVLLMSKAYHGEKYKLPWAGDQAEKWAGK